LDGPIDGANLLATAGVYNP